MNIWRLTVLAVAGMFSGCTEMTTPPEPEIRLIPMEGGRICDEGRCLRYYESLHTVQIIGHEMTGIPGVVILHNEQVTPRDFLRLYYAAQGADWQE